MKLSRKISFIFFASIIAMAVLNVIAFYALYSINITRYLSEKIDTRQEVTLDYINSLVERQTLDELEQIFSESELEFFELLDISWWVISLDSDRNINIVVNFLVRSWISPRYIEEIIPENNLEKVLLSLWDSDSPEAKFIQRLIWGIVGINIVFLILLWTWVYIISQRTIKPLQKVTKILSEYKLWEIFEPIEYDRKDEIGLLIQSINTLNRKLSLQDSIRTRLIADISHELKTPITSLQCYLEWIWDGVIKLDDEVLSTLNSEMKRLTKLVDMILEYQKFESKNELINKENFQPYKIISEVLNHSKTKATKTRQDFLLSWSENIEIYAEKDLFKQLTYNVVWNFLKYAWRDTQLQIDITSHKISFIDNWKGISQKELPYLFEKFYQWKKEKTWDAASRGIWVGLSMIKKICDLHGWKVELESDIKQGFWLHIYIR